MALTESCLNRLMNYKFRSAAEELTGEATEEEREIVEALTIFGNPGWFLGGQMETIINAAIDSMVPEQFEEGEG